jgi:hypothetical protein
VAIADRAAARRVALRAGNESHCAAQPLVDNRSAIDA